MPIKSQNKPKLDTYEDILCKYLKEEKKPTRAVEMALEEYNNSREEKNGISIATAWRKYNKIKNKFKK